MEMTSWEEIMYIPEDKEFRSTCWDDSSEVTRDVKSCKIKFLFCGSYFMVWIEGWEVPEIEGGVFEESGKKRAIRSEFRVHEWTIMSKYRS